MLDLCSETADTAVRAGLRLSVTRRGEVKPSARQPEDAADADLVSGFLAGDQGCFGRLVERYKRPLRRFVGSELGRAAHLADDVTQEAFIAAYRSLRSFRGRSSFKTWLYAVARNSCRRELRRQENEAAVGDGSEDDLLGIPDLGPDPLRSLRDQEVRRLLVEALAELPPPLRTALLLRGAEGLAYEEIAQILQVPVGTVRSRLHNARARLARSLARIRS